MRKVKLRFGLLLFCCRYSMIFPKFKLNGGRIIPFAPLGSSHSGLFDFCAFAEMGAPSPQPTTPGTPKMPRTPRTPRTPSTPDPPDPHQEIQGEVQQLLSEMHNSFKKFSETIFDKSKFYSFLHVLFYARLELTNFSS